MTEETIFYRALELPNPDERAAYLDEACGNDTELRQRVEALLQSHEGAGSFLQPQPADQSAPVKPAGNAGEQPLPLTLDSDAGAKSTAGDALPLGTAVRYFGDYELRGEIARGGMGIVYRARQVSVNRPVAVKMILAGNLADARDVQRFYTEAEAAANLDHPNIVPIYEVGEHEGQHFFSMKLIEGSNLNLCLPRYLSDPLAAARVVASVARAVHHAHQRGILHRDLKPGNILLDADGRAHVTDFGLAKRIDSREGLTQSGAIVGTPEYMSPEQASGQKDLTIASDVYSLGAILYALLTGRPPFQGENVLHTLQQVVSNEPVAPSKLQPGVPRDLETICLKCLQKDPTRRYGSAEELAEDLRRFEAHEPIMARPVGPFERALRWCRRNPVVAGLLLLVVAVLLAGTAVSTYFGIQANVNANRAEQKAIDEKQAREAAEIARRQAEDLAVSEARARKAEEQRTRELAEQIETTRKALTRAEFVAYAFQIGAAQQAVHQGDVARARAILNNTAPKLHGWEHDFVLRQTLKLQLDLGEHAAAVNGVAFSPDGGRIVSGSDDNTLKVWNADTGEEVLHLKGHGKAVMAVAFSPDGKRIISGSKDRTLRVWNATTGQTELTLKGHTDAVNAVAVSPDGNWAVSASDDRTVKVWDLSTGKEARTLKGHLMGVLDVAISPDGKRIVSASWDKTLKIWQTLD